MTKLKYTVLVDGNKMSSHLYQSDAISLTNVWKNLGYENVTIEEVN